MLDNRSQKPLDETLIEEPTEWQFKLGTFVVEKKILFKRFIYFALLFIDLIILTNAGIKWVDYYASQEAYQQMVGKIGQQLVDYQSYKIRNQPEDLQVLKTEAIVGGRGLYDIAARIRNNNADWVAERLRYRFIVGTQTTDIQETHVLPEQSKLIVSYNFAPHSADNPGGVKLEIIEVGWQKNNDPQRKQIYQEIKVSNQQYVLNDDGTGQVVWDVDNTSAYSFWQVGYQVVLYDGSHNTIGVNYFEGQQLISQDKKTYTVTWYNKLPSVYEVEVMPEVNVFDQSVYMPLGVNN